MCPGNTRCCLFPACPLAFQLGWRVWLVARVRCGVTPLAIGATDDAPGCARSARMADACHVLLDHADAFTLPVSGTLYHLGSVGRAGTCASHFAAQPCGGLDAPLVMGLDMTDDSQKWLFTPVGGADAGTFFIESATRSGCRRFLSVSSSDCSAAAVQLWDSAGSTNQAWRVVWAGSGTFRLLAVGHSACAGKWMAVEPCGSSSALVQTMEADGSGKTVWAILRADACECVRIVCLCMCGVRGVGREVWCVGWWLGLARLLLICAHMHELADAWHRSSSGPCLRSVQHVQQPAV